MIAAPAHLPITRHADDARIAAANDERRELVLECGRRFGDSEHDDVVGRFGVRDEMLAAVEQPSSRRFPGSRAKSAEIRSRIRLGQCVRDDLPARQNVRQKLRSLTFIRLRKLQRQVTEYFAQRHRRMRDFFENRYFRSRRKPRTANAFGKVESVQAECRDFGAQLREQFVADVIVGLDLLFEGYEPVAHESMCGFSDHGYFVVDLVHDALFTKTISMLCLRKPASDEALAGVI
ncbi:hypothetical protein PCAR4_780045 [Paraburkholderia caribensis]|nr:hypothetical protein PCAR4_780045 [Paraburkholderia caribensis]